LLFWLICEFAIKRFALKFFVVPKIGQQLMANVLLESVEYAANSALEVAHLHRAVVA